MSKLDTMTDEGLSEMIKRAMRVEMMEIYNAEREVLTQIMSGHGLKISAKTLREQAKQLLKRGPVFHPYDDKGERE